ncbi:MAG: helix-turn-helix domain-containing protein [Fretibacterium sp.]|nr:helix-turn-helix domain-containing protein [Fretibacterium sp.]
MDVSERIRERRKADGLSQIALAERLGMSYMTVRRWEGGKRTPRMEELQRLADALGTTVPYLMGIDAPEANTSPIRGPFVLKAAPRLKAGSFSLGY